MLDTTLKIEFDSGGADKDVAAAIEQRVRKAIAPFDAMAALELALLAETVRKHAGKKKGDSGGTWAKVKFDWQIVAISKAQNVTTIYSEDPEIKKLAAFVGITVKSAADLPLPPKPYSGKGPGLFD